MPNRRIVLYAVALVALSLQLLGCGGGGSRSLSVSASLPTSGTVGTAYSGSLTVSGGTFPYTWTVSGLPAGLTASGTSSATLTVSGTPTTTGTSSVSISVADSNNNAVSSTVRIVIAAAGTLSVTTTSLPNGTMNAAYSVTLAATGGTPPYTWSEASGGSLPPGLSLTGGVISGTPTIVGSYGPYVFTVTDSTSATASSGSLTLVVAAPSSAACGPSPALRGNESAIITPFAFLVRGSDGSNLPVAYAGSFTPNGIGGIKAADVDYISVANGPESLAVTLASSSYSFGSDGRGCLYLSFSGLNPSNALRPAKAQTKLNLAAVSRYRHPKANLRAEQATVLTNVVFSFALGSTSSTPIQGGITEFDDTTGSGTIASGQIHSQTASDFAVANLASNFAFGFEGWSVIDANNDISRSAIAGSFANANGALSAGVADYNVGGDVTSDATGGSGTLNSTVSSTTGRGTGSYSTSTSGITFDFAYYVVDANDVYVISTDSVSAQGDVLLSGRALGSSATTAAPSGYYIAATSGLDLSQGPAGVGANVVSIATVQLNNTGGIPTTTVYVNDAGTFSTNTYTSGTYTLDANSGRVAITGTTEAPPVIYLTANSEIVGFVVGTDSAASSGQLLLQTTSTPSYNTSSIAGNYTFWSTEDVAGFAGTEVGVYGFTSGGNYSATLDIVDLIAGLSPGQTVTGTISSVNSDGSGTFDSGAKALVTNGNIILAIDQNSTLVSQQPLLYVFLAATPASN